MKVVLLIHDRFPGPSAAARRFELLGRGLYNAGVDVSVVTPAASTDECVAEYRGISVKCPKGGGMDSGKLVRMRIREILDAEVAAGADWVISFSPSLGQIPIIWSLRERALVGVAYDDVPVRCRSEGAKGRIVYMKNCVASLCAPRIAALNVGISTHLVSRLAKLAPSRPTYRLPPMVDTDVFVTDDHERNALRKKVGVNGECLIGYVGSFWNVDGVANLIRAVQLLKDQQLPVRLLVAGAKHSGLDCDDVQGLVAAAGLSKITHMPGWVDAKEVTRILSAVDIVVIPKLDHPANRAGVPIKLAEYLSVGKAIVASKVGDIPLYVEHNKNALLVVPGDVADLASALRRLVLDFNLRASLGSRARRVAAERFDYRSASAAFSNVLKKFKRIAV